MTAVTFGDILRASRADLERALAEPGEPAANTQPTAQALYRIATTMSHYAADLTPYQDGELSAENLAHLDPWMRAAVQARDALLLAAESLRPQAGHLDHVVSGGEPAAGPGSPDHLSGAAAALAAGRDLLRSHFSTSPQGTRLEHSGWAPVVASPPVARALLEEIAAWSRRLAPLAARLSLHDADPAVAATTRQGLHAASWWLWTAAAAVEPARQASPVTAPQRELLHAIPGRTAPARQPPDHPESVPELCAGLTVSAERLRAAVRNAAPEAGWSPAARRPAPTSPLAAPR